MDLVTYNGLLWPQNYIVMFCSFSELKVNLAFNEPPNNIILKS